jgi:hypothetical protein
VLLRWLLAGLAGWGMYGPGDRGRTERVWVVTVYVAIGLTLLISGVCLYFAVKGTP